MEPFSIIIPAYNEKQSIKRCLEGLARSDSQYEIIVVCNGCNDGTHLVVRQFLPDLICLETDTASKTNALQMGDDVARFFPRIYLDADVEMSLSHAINLARAVKTSGLCAMSPSVETDPSHSSALVKSFYRVWQSLPYFREGLMGAGVYCLSEQGRSRFDRWPDVISDDGFVRMLFRHNERGVCPDARVRVHAPRDFRSLLRVKTRSRLGGYQLAQRFPELCRRERRGKNYWKTFAPFVSRPTWWFDCCVYLVINMMTRLRARRQIPELTEYQWARDQSTR